tara:strand:- start:1253 stop:3685 length:2433 start_codon:yes stop_codon:yes gene_type:complete
MTYKEVNDRLTKVQSALNQLKSGKLDSAPVKTQAQLEIIKESLQKKLTTLKEAEETMFVSTKGGSTKAVAMDSKTAMDLKKDPSITGIESAKGKTIKEEEITVEQNQEIAKKVGKALANSLRKVGDELDTMKARNFNPTNDASYFDIYVEYKASDKTDDFKFAIKDGILSLQGKELGAVGFLPSGEIQIHTEIIEAALIKHFELDMKEDMRSKDKEFEKSREADRLEKHPESDTIKKIQALIGKEKSLGETEDEANTSGAVGAYLTPNAFGKKKKKDKLYEDPSYIDIIGQFAALMATGYTAYQAVEKLGDGNGDISIDSIKKAIHKYSAPKNEDAEEVINTDDDFEREQLAQLATRNEDAEEDAKNDADYEAGWNDDPRQDEDLDVGHQDDEPSMLGASALETAEYAAKLYKKLQRYDQQDGEVDFPNWWQKKLILARDYMSAAYHYLDSEEKQPALDQLALESVVKEENTDKEMGHNNARDIMGYLRGKIYPHLNDQELEEFRKVMYDHFKDPVNENLNEGTELYDRNGIQIKRFSGGPKGLMVQVTLGTEIVSLGDTLVIPASEYPNLVRAMQSVQGDLKDMSRQIPRDKNMDENVDRVAGGYPYRVEGNKAVITEPMDDATKERIIKRCEDAGYHCAPNQAGGITITLKKGTYEGQGMNERLNGDQQEALIELQNVLDQAAELADEAREIVREKFPNQLSRGDAYGIFNFGTSGNQYDHTLESMISDIEEEAGEDQGDDMDEGVAKTKKAHDKVVSIMKDLAKKYREGDKSVVDQLKLLTINKKKLEAMLDKDVAGLGVDQEVTEI